MKNKTTKTEVKHNQVKKLTENDLKKITGGLKYGNDDCFRSPVYPSCLAYLVYP